MKEGACTVNVTDRSVVVLLELTVPRENLNNWIQTTNDDRVQF